jgi:hypothetical protein
MTELTNKDIHDASEAIAFHMQIKGGREVSGSASNSNKKIVAYWTERIESRLFYLQPLIRELMTKGIVLSDVSYSLNQEYLSLIHLKTIEI